MVGEWNDRDGIGKTSTLENSLQPQCNCKQGPDMYPAAVNPLILVMVKMQSLIKSNSEVQPMHQADFSVGLLTSYGENTQSAQPNYSVPTTNYQASQMPVLVEIYILLHVQPHIK
ncbi:unnamed protein product [Citrullus colocynthis]|uniref:Uncharacterized protein n=1 Tax=Citrullus colocynthis TaxID=252529 RepID=A0ABP0XQQ6_9ROSI